MWTIEETEQHKNAREPGLLIAEFGRYRVVDNHRYDNASTAEEEKARAEMLVSAQRMVRELIQKDELVRSWEEADAQHQREGQAKADRAENERDDLKEALTDLMPFVLEDYHPSCATPAYKAAVERAMELTGITKGASDVGSVKENT